VQRNSKIGRKGNANRKLPKLTLRRHRVHKVFFEKVAPQNNSRRKEGGL
jgi:hypothetical protein